MTFKEKFELATSSSGGYVCVGLDPDMAKMPPFLAKKGGEGLRIFLAGIVRATVPYAAAYKLNLAFFEVFGGDGWEALKDLVKAMPDDRIIIADGKRGDIGNSARFYAKALFGDMDFDAATVNPYMGYDAVKPFIEDAEKGAFILALTSNPGADDFQFSGGEKRLFEAVTEKAVEWNSLRNIGLVTGATRPEFFNSIREIAPDLPLLIPGVGAQGGDLKAVVDNALKGFSGKGVVNSSQGIIYASSGEDYAEAAGAAAAELRDSINVLL